MKNPKFEIFAGKDGKFYFRLRATNGQVILQSEGYNTKTACGNGIESVRKNAASDERFDRKTSSSGQHFFSLTATNGQTIGKSQMYKSAPNREKGITAVARVAPDAPVLDTTEA